MSSKKSGDTEDITTFYLNLTKTYQSTYGTKTVILLQVGAFFEIYGFRRPDGEIAGSPISDVCNLCNLNMSEKKISVEGCPVLMAGFRDYTLEKYLPRFAEAGYTAVIYTQEMVDGKVVGRSLKEIISPGTYLSYEMEGGAVQSTNNIMCLWMEPIGMSSKRMVYGVAVINIFTGKSTIFEKETDARISTTSIDELERFVTVHSPTEVILIHSLKEVSPVLQYSGIRTDKIHMLDISKMQPNTPAFTKITNASRQNYIKQILTERFGVDAYSVCSEFGFYPLATQAYCYLLNFIQEHNPHLIERIGLPTFQNTTGSMILANHTLKQLNILDDASADGRRAGNLSSVFALVNKCCTVMGKRKLYAQITHPIFDPLSLNQEYDMIDYVKSEKNEWLIPFLRTQLNSIRDMERLCRNLLLGKLSPSAIYHLYQNIEILSQINESFAEHPLLNQYICRDISPLDKEPYQYIKENATRILCFLQSKLKMDVCKTLASASVEEQYIARGVSAEYDDLVDTYEKQMTAFQTIHTHFNEVMQKSSGSQNDTTEYVKIHETDKSGYSLQITKKRAILLKTYLAEMVKRGTAKCSIGGGTTIIDFHDAKCVSASGSADEIEFKELGIIIRGIQNSKEAIVKKQAELFTSILREFVELWFSHVEKMSSAVANMDTLQTKAYVAKTYGYCRPVIDAAAAKSFVSVKGLRHGLIEHLNTSEVYVANDLSLGKEIDGVLLYGTNAVGKTSFIRALGIAVVMAQSGFFVPCSEFVYKPYTAIYSRILGNDNIFKGLSTFAVEMSELRLILNMADQNSLILGDELCSGTETESALAIFMAGLLKIHSLEASFLFATHFHEILKFEEIKEMKKMVSMHMAVEYNRELDSLVYDRKLRMGAGTRMYGLEVCQSLHLPLDFLEKAYELRGKLNPDSRGSLSSPTTHYNVEKVRAMCEMCGEAVGTETHHLLEQQTANSAGFIGGVHKNHPANLASICETCHKAEHRQGSSRSASSSPVSSSLVETIKSKKKTIKGKMVIMDSSM
jgi:DNA mismatch repair protein MutS